MKIIRCGAVPATSKWRMQEINIEMLQAEGNEIVQLMRESLAIRDRLKRLKQKGVDVEEVEDEIK